MSSGLLSYAEAAAVVHEYGAVVARPAIESVALEQAPGRVLAQPVCADQDQPSFSRSTRDGFACRADEAVQDVWLPVAGSTHAGEAPAAPLPARTAWEIMTGAPIPEGADAVIMLEHVEREKDRIRLQPGRTIRPGENIVTQGAQARAGQELISTGSVLGPAQIALAAACGYPKVDVFVRPRVAILTTGDELVPTDATPGPGQIRNSNASMLAALVAATGGDPWVLPPVPDTAEALDSALRQAMHADLLLISGGVSAGKFDLVEPALARLGAKFFFTGVRIQPGKPLVFGAAPRAADPSASMLGKPEIPFFGLPGNPISSAATFLLFAAQVLRALAGNRSIEPCFLAAQLSQATDRKAKPGLTRFLPARYELAAGGQLPRVATIPWHGSGDLPAFARSNCFVVLPQNIASLNAGAIVRILPF